MVGERLEELVGNLNRVVEHAMVQLPGDICRNAITVPSRAPKDAPDACVNGAACPIVVLEVVKQQKIVLRWLTKTSKFEKSASVSMLPNRNTQPKQIV
jgi:hypothetical protein